MFYPKNNPESTDKFSLLSINSGLFHSNSETIHRLRNSKAC